MSCLHFSWSKRSLLIMCSQNVRFSLSDFKYTFTRHFYIKQTPFLRNMIFSNSFKESSHFFTYMLRLFKTRMISFPLFWCSPSFRHVRPLGDSLTYLYHLPLLCPVSFKFSKTAHNVLKQYQMFKKFQLTLPQHILVTIVPHFNIYILKTN